MDVLSPLQGVVVAVLRVPGDAVSAGTGVVVVEALKMEHVVPAPTAGTLRTLSIAVGDRVRRDDPLFVLAPAETFGPGHQPRVQPGLAPRPGPDQLRPELAELLRRRLLLTDEGRPEAVARRHKDGRRTVREDLDDLRTGAASPNMAGWR